MRIIKKTILICVLLLAAFGTFVYAEMNPVNAYLFYGKGCPHCALERQYVSEVLKEKYPELRVYEYEIYHNRENTSLLQEATTRLGVVVEGVPFLIIGDETFVGFSKTMSPQKIENKVHQCLIGGCPDSVATVMGIETPKDENHISQENPVTEINEYPPASEEKNITLPFLGTVNVMEFSIPVLTVIMGMLDGFNPCALWTLLFLISILIGMKDRKRMWILGSAFIVASASVYFLFMSAWLNLILFLGFVSWIRILIGALALFGGAYGIREFIRNKSGVCKITDNEKRIRVFEKLKTAVHQNSMWLAMGGIVILAFAVNLVELICSAGLPAVYTQVLALNDMAGWNHYLYILFYILFFMLDDLFIFFAAMFTLEMTGITTKYARASRLIGGLVMLAIGLMLIFKPGWLMFG